VLGFEAWVIGFRASGSQVSVTKKRLGARRGSRRGLECGRGQRLGFRVSGLEGGRYLGAL
jgi:hypothetical protein